MKSSAFMVGLVLAACAACAGCGARPLPAARVGSAEAAVRAARENGATRLPDAALHVRLAEDQITRARRLIDEGEHQRAEWLLVRAEADANVAAALVREAQQTTAAEEVAGKVRVATEGPTP